MRPRKTILCVEDNEQVLSVRKFLLETRGYRVVALSCGADALNFLREAMPGSVDLLMSDLIMPQMDGNELVRRAKQLHPCLPALLVSGTVTSFERAASADAFLPKGASTPAEVETAARQVLENAKRNCPDAAIDGILVQEMLQDGVEFLLGMTYDPQFGPLIVCGAGGVTVEVFKDAAVLLPPFARDDVVAALGRLKVKKLLDGFRGAPPRDVDALIACCLRFADFATATDGKFAAIDLNPVFVRARGGGVRIADALMETLPAAGGSP